MSKHTTFIFLVLLLMACQSPDSPSTLPSTDEPLQPEESMDRISISRSQLELAQVTWGAISAVSEKTDQTLYGEWTLHPADQGRVHTLLPGRIKSLQVQLNESVVEGQVLAWVESSNLIAIEEEFLEGRSTVDYLTKEEQRQDTLAARQAVPQKDAEAARAAAAKARANLAARRADLVLLGINPATVSPDNFHHAFAIRAPRSGRITSLFVGPGQWVAPEDPLFHIHDFRRLHADLFVYPKTAFSFSVGQEVTLLHQGRELAGNVVSVDRTLDPEHRAQRVHVIPQNPTSIAAVEGGYLEARIPRAETTGEITLPLSAVRREEGLAFILEYLPHVSTPEAVSFRKHGVTILREDDQQVLVQRPEGLSPSAEVVLNGAYYIDAQSKVSEFGEE